MAEIMATLHTFRASDGYAFYYRRYAPAGRPRARLVLVHGIRSHGGWYERSCREFAAAGFEVFFLDRRGCGLNTAHRGDTPGFRRLLDDLAEFVLDLRADRPWLATVLAGISWGGKLALGLGYRRPGLVNGLVLICPGLAPKIAPSFIQHVKIFHAAVRRPNLFFPIPLNEPELFTASPEWQRFVADEPHGLRQASARFLFASFTLDYYLMRAVNWAKSPTLLLLAERDRIIDNERTRKIVSRFSTPDQTVIEYAGADHTLEFEPAGHPWVSDVDAWIGKILG